LTYLTYYDNITLTKKGCFLMDNKEISKLTKLVRSYIKNNRNVDENFIYDLAEIVIKQRKLGDYVKNIIISNEQLPTGAIAYYDSFDNDIKISNDFGDDNIIDNITKYLHIILHEIEHASQYKTVDSGKNTLETLLLKQCFLGNIFKRKYQNIDVKKLDKDELLKLYAYLDFYTKAEIELSKIYECLPSERQAEIKSFIELINVCNNIKDERLSSVTPNFYKNYYIRKIMGYRNDNGIIKSPTNTLMTLLDELSGEKNDAMHNYIDKVTPTLTLDERLYYGLKISQDEYKSEIVKCV